MPCEPLHDRPPRPKSGRHGTAMPGTTRHKAIGGIFWILDNCVRWEDLSILSGTKWPVPLGFQPLEKIVAFLVLLAEIGSIVEECDGFNPYECHFGGVLSKAKDGGCGIGCTKAGKGVKIMSMVDAKALLIAVNTGSASSQESSLSKPIFNLMLTVDFSERLLGGKGHDPDKPGHALVDHGADMISRHRSARKPEKNSRRLQAAQIQAAPDNRAQDRWLRNC